MAPNRPISRRMVLRAGAALIAAAFAAPAFAYWAPPASPLAAVDVYDRTTGSALTLYEKDGRRYVVGAPGNEYAVRIRNCTGRRILAVTSVDGVNVITGDTASPDQSGYVIEPWGSVEIAGWRKSMSHTAAFYFTNLGDSYAARTGRPFDVGVIGVAVFAERAEPVVTRRQRIAGGSREESADHAGRLATMPASAPAEADASSAERAANEAVAGAPVAPHAEARHRARPHRVVVGTASQLRARDHRARASCWRSSTTVTRISPRSASCRIVRPMSRARHPRPFPGMRFVPGSTLAQRHCTAWARALRRPGRARILGGPCPPRAAPADDASDEDLMLAYAGGSAASFDRLYARHRDPCTGTCCATSAMRRPPTSCSRTSG